MLSLIAMMIAAAQAGAVQAAPAATRIVILADERLGARLRAALVAPGGGPAYRDADGGMHYASCVAAWRRDARQAEACLRSRLPEDGRHPVVVLNGYHAPPARGGHLVTCISWAGSGRVLLHERQRGGDSLPLGNCLRDSLRRSPGPAAARPPAFGVRHTDRFAQSDAGAARRAARVVAVIAIDHVGVPRGSTGACNLQGRIHRVERGAGPVPGGRIGLSVPCGADRARPSGRLIGMGDLRRGTFARIYLGDRNSLEDIEPFGG